MNRDVPVTAGILTVSAFVVFMFGCGGSRAYVDTSRFPDTYQCRYTKDVCKEAQEFERKYKGMTKEERQEFRNLLMTYRSQCNDALKACSESAKSVAK